MSIKIGKRFIVLRSSESVDSSERIPIILAPGKAFGSGEHETTRNCLEELENIPIFPHSKVLDLGCGTGILSIAAAKIGARSVIALDPDPDAIKATANNIRLNRLEKIILPFKGELREIRETSYDLKDTHLDLIMANLYGDILLALVADLTSLLKPGGYMLLSGIEFEYAYESKAGLINAGCKLLKTRFLDEYCTMVFQKNLKLSHG
jgi:ribosomal protein L11 methyltransferase